MNSQEFESPQSGKKTGVLCVFQGVYFHVRKDAINEERNLINPNVLKPISRLGGISYSRVKHGIEIPRPDFNKESDAVEQLLKARQHQE